MSPSTTLPIGIPRLDALVMAEAEQRADALAALLPYEQHHGPTTTEIARAFEALLRDLTRPESRDWAARALAEIIGWSVCDVHQAAGGSYSLFCGLCRRVGLAEPERWEPPPDPKAALALALAEVCRG